MEEGIEKETPKAETNMMAILAYLGPLCLIPLLTGEKDEFVKFHVRQGVVLLIGEALIWVVFGFILGSMTWSWYAWGTFGMFAIVQNLAYLFLGVLSIVGIINVINGQQKELPVLGKYAEKVKFVK